MKRFVYISIWCLVGFIIASNSFTDHYIFRLKGGESLPASQQYAPLYNEILERVKDYERLPQDARIDPVWKAIPGLNGIKVDVDASYKKMKKENKFNEEKLVFSEVKPKIHLKDLPPTAIYKGHPDKPMVAFIINVAWGNEYLSDILSTLKKHHVKASFFLEGRWTKNYPELAKMIVSAGHEVGNHSYTHPDMKHLAAARIRKEIQLTTNVIKATTDVVPKWLAPPSGSYRDEVVQIAASEKLGTVMWSVDTIDWQKPSPDVLIQRVMKKVHNGALILMHPTESTANALDQLIIQIKSKNLEIDTVSSLLSEELIIKNGLKKNIHLGKNKNNNIY